MRVTGVQRVATQPYQWATAWPDPPSRFNEHADWQTLETHTILREVEDNGHGGWRYKFTKDGDNPCTIDPLP